MNDPTTNADALPRDSQKDVLTDVLRQGATRLLAQAIQAEVAAYLDAYAPLRDEAGRQQVVRNGSLPQRTILTGIGPVEVKQPRVQDRRPEGQREQFRSAILPPYLRKTKCIAELIPWLSRKGISTGDFAKVLAALLGPPAKGLSAPPLPRLQVVGAAEDDAWSTRSLAGKHYVDVWADGVHCNIRREEDRQCLLVLLGAPADGKKELIALGDGLRESEQSWKALLLDCPARGMTPAPTRAVVMGPWCSLEGIAAGVPDAQGAAVLSRQDGRCAGQAAPGPAAHGQGAAARHLAGEHQGRGREGVRPVRGLYEAKYAKATDCLRKDREELLVCYDFPALPWLPLRTPNPIEATFAPVRRRPTKTKGSGYRSACLTRVFKLRASASKKGRLLNGEPLLANALPRRKPRAGAGGAAPVGDSGVARAAGRARAG